MLGLLGSSGFLGLVGWCVGCVKWLMSLGWLGRVAQGWGGSGWLVVGLAGLCVGLVGWFGWSTCLLVCLCVGWLVHRLVVWLVVGLIVCLVCCWAGWLAGWLVGWLVARLTVRPPGRGHARMVSLAARTVFNRLAVRADRHLLMIRLTSCEDRHHEKQARQNVRAH